jgi:shikimate kinase
VITDNGKNIILEHRKADEKDVILLIPEEKIRKPSLPKEKLYGVADAVRRLVPRTKDDWCDALTKNGHIVAEALGLDDRIAGKAMSLGALAAGVSGTGPAVSVVVGKGEGRSFLKELEHGGYSAIITGTR